MSDRPTPDISTPARSALVRDLLIFVLKLWLDGLKDVVLFPVALGTASIDFVFRTRSFYRVLRAGERFDLWLNLFGAARSAGRNVDGLFGASEAGSPTLLGELEQLQGGERHAQEKRTRRV